MHPVLVDDFQFGVVLLAFVQYFWEFWSVFTPCVTSEAFF